MDENKIRNVKRKKTGRFNILDLIIIIVVLFVIAVAVMLAVPKLQEIAVTGKKIQISYTVVFENVSDSVSIALDQTVIDAESGRSLGTVMIVEPVSYYDYVLSTDAVGNSVAKKHLYDDIGKNITVTVNAMAVYEEGKGYVVDGYRIAVGREMELRFADFNGTGRCNGINIIG